MLSILLLRCYANTSRLLEWHLKIFRKIMFEDFCIRPICGEGEEKSKLSVVKNGLGTIIHSSKLREDKIYQVVAGKSTARVHADCRKTYINPKSTPSRRPACADHRPTSSTSKRAASFVVSLYQLRNSASSTRRQTR